MAERMIAANGVELCSEPFGDPDDPPILLVMGIGASMLWWEEGFCRFVTTAEVDWSDPASVTEYLVDYQRVLAGGQRPFEEAAVSDLVRRDVERSRDVASLQNHDAIPQ